MEKGWCMITVYRTHPLLRRYKLHVHVRIFQWSFLVHHWRVHEILVLVFMIFYSAAASFCLHFIADRLSHFWSNHVLRSRFLVIVIATGFLFWFILFTMYAVFWKFTLRVFSYPLGCSISNDKYWLRFFLLTFWSLRCNIFSSVKALDLHFAVSVTFTTGAA